MTATLVLAAVVVFLCLDRHRLVTQHERTVSGLLNRIKPETAQPVLGVTVDAEPAVELEGPQADDDYWEARKG